MAQIWSIRVLNPNSNKQVTTGIKEAIQDIAEYPNLNITCSQLDQAPLGIETAEHIRTIEPMITQDITSQSYDAHVIACFSDPGVQLLRETGISNIFGIAESAILLAAGIIGQFGIISILPESVKRHHTQIAKVGLKSRLAADIPLNMSVLELANEERTKARLIEVGTELKVSHNASSLILGCAGMAGYRSWLEKELGLPVIEPCRAAIAMAVAHLTALKELNI